MYGFRDTISCVFFIPEFSGGELKTDFLSSVSDNAVYKYWKEIGFLQELH